MIMKIIVNTEDKQKEVFQISQYYTECGNYLEAEKGSTVEVGGREIILQDGLSEGEEIEEVIIYTDQMVEILRLGGWD